MRLNLRKVYIIGGVAALLWFFVTYSSLIEGPKMSPAKNNVLVIENRIEKLQQQINEQVYDSSLLLEKVKKHLKNTDAAVYGDSEKIIMPGKEHFDNS